MSMYIAKIFAKGRYQNNGRKPITILEQLVRPKGYFQGKNKKQKSEKDKHKRDNDPKYAASEVKKMMEVYQKIVYIVGVVDTVEGFKTNTSLEQLIQLKQLAKEYLPRQIYNSKEFQGCMRKINEGIEYFKGLRENS